MKARATANRSAPTNHEASRPLDGVRWASSLMRLGSCPDFQALPPISGNIVLFHTPRPKTDLPLWTLLGTNAVNER